MRAVFAGTVPSGFPVDSFAGTVPCRWGGSFAGVLLGTVPYRWGTVPGRLREGYLARWV